MNNEQYIQSLLRTSVEWTESARIKILELEAKVAELEAEVKRLQPVEKVKAS